MELNEKLYRAILDAYPYEIVYVDRTHIVRWLNRTAKRRYGETVRVGGSLLNCHNESTKPKIEEFLRRADNGEDEMFEVWNGSTGEREFFVPVRDEDGQVIGYFERHEVPWDREHADEPVGDYWKRKADKIGEVPKDTE